jgi:hypothetical protein
MEINACVKVLLSCVHGGTLWLDPPVSIDTVDCILQDFQKYGEDQGPVVQQGGRVIPLRVNERKIPDI